MTPPRTVVVVNPKSQGGATGKRWPELAARLRKHFAFEDAITSGPGDATRLTREALAGGVERVVALGGDGTINEVVNGFFTDGTPVAPTAALGVIPYGTGGDFRRTMNLSTELDDAAATIAADSRRTIDVGRIEYTTPDGGTTARMFANICSFGISGVVDRLVNQSKKRFGRLSYALATARATLFQYDNQRVHLRFDDDPASATDVTINTVAVANGRYFGGAMKVAPDAEVDDGVFDVVCLGDFGKAEILFKGTRVYKGAHLTMDKVTSRRARIVDATPVDPGATVEIDLDGENVGRLPARFTIVPRALVMVVPVAPPSQATAAPKTA
jgi:YegS/Rv2252/BmrU family lipid kinase